MSSSAGEGGRQAAGGRGSAGEGGRQAAGGRGAPEHPISTRLRDGTPVVVRMVEPGDKQAVVEGMARLSTRSRYLRFHSGIRELSDKQLRYLTEVDQRDHVAWAAFTREGDHEVGIGVARFVRVTNEPEVAEAAITVLDEYQGRGLGTLLLGVLSAAAVRRGVRTFRSYVLGENVSMLNLFDALGAERTLEEPGVYRVDVGVPQLPSPPADTPIGRIIRAVTGGRLPRMRTIAPPVWVSEDTGNAASRETRAGASGEPRPGDMMLRDWLDHVLDRTVRPRRDRASRDR